MSALFLKAFQYITPSLDFNLHTAGILPDEEKTDARVGRAAAQAVQVGRVLRGHLPKPLRVMAQQPDLRRPLVKGHLLARKGRIKLAQRQNFAVRRR